MGEKIQMLVFQKIILKYIIFIIPFLIPFPVPAASWWSAEKVEESKTVAEGIRYQRILFETVFNEPVRAHIVSVTASGQYIFGVLGSYGALFTPTQFSRSSNALVTINGSYFSENPTRALGMIMAHSRILYPPPANKLYHGTVGFSARDVFFDFITPKEVSAGRIKTEKNGWHECHAALGSGPMLIHQSRALIQSATEGFNLIQRAPRTAIGKRKDGTTLLLVIDGRQPGWSAGVTLDELTELFLSRNASDALNLDGGGSSTLVINETLINRPSDGSIHGNPGVERPVANVVALFRRE
ncbi:MAG: phosphodiester glycosidase family protein [bacterium]